VSSSSSVFSFTDGFTRSDARSPAQRRSTFAASAFDLGTRSEVISSHGVAGRSFARRITSSPTIGWHVSPTRRK
jgi:hypothetical protein